MMPPRPEKYKANKLQNWSVLGATFKIIGRSGGGIPPAPQPPFFTFKTKASGEVSFNIVNENAVGAIWYMGDGTIIPNTNSVTHTYADGTEKTVSVSVQDFGDVIEIGSLLSKEITEIYFSELSSLTQNLDARNNTDLSILQLPIGASMRFIRATNSALQSVDASVLLSAITGFEFTGSGQLQSFIFPSGFSCIRMRFYNCDLRGTLDYSGIINITNEPVQLSGNTSLEKVNPNLGVSGIIATLNPIFDEIINFELVQWREVWLKDLPLLTHDLEFNSSQLNTVTIENIGSSIIDLSNSTALFVLTISNQDATVSLPLSGNSLRGIAISELLTTTVLDFSNVSFGNSLGGQKFIQLCPDLTTIMLPNEIKEEGVFILDCPLVSSVDIGIQSTWPNFDKASIRVIGAALPASEVNRILTEIDGLATSNLTWIRDIDLSGGTSGAPDSSSGGNDGLAAKASLQAKGFNVITN